MAKQRDLEKRHQQDQKEIQPQASAQRLRGTTLEVRLEELGVLRSFSRLRVSNDNPYSESPFRAIKYRPYYPNRPFSNIEEACQWVSSFVDCYNHQHRHSGGAIAICKKQTDLYEQARLANPKRWSTSIRFWKHPDLVWINPPDDDFIAKTAKLALAA